ncbi:LysM peptidoglycan-binding domain-containing protein [Planctobacterium marinum]|uniref:LysM peptidoglycan-binding domain-containing protein n=1 Tax=Planctobacterium marinum TaxID=1631968 RepID=UPI001E41578D|nr:LysM domain-containing protein [Planctobacterium marinum]MCC2607234.1 LysM peptidoglycan-binding domain-containing protein [Planctobacterium marinum]
MKYRIFSLILALMVSVSGSAVEIKASAPDVYVVKKGDTLWQIAGMYLDKPWNWPLLWQQNTQIENPHLIYPGDRLLLERNANGDTVLSMVRNEKRQIQLSPKAIRELKNPDPIPTIPWSIIETHIRNDLVMEKALYEAQPYLLGDQEGAVRFAHTDVVLGKKGGFQPEQYQVVREHSELTSMQGEALGYLVKHVAIAEPINTELETEMLVQIKGASQEVKRGDRLIPLEQRPISANVDMVPATTQSGNIIASLQDRSLLGKYDTVVIDVGFEQVSPGMVMGIYLQGPDIIDDEPLRYDESELSLLSIHGDSDRIRQPAIKVGELVVFKTFNKVSYALITASTSVIRKGAIVARP